jgi:hypothetical protein
VSLTLLVLGAITLPGVPKAEEAVELVDVQPTSKHSSSAMRTVGPCSLENYLQHMNLPNVLGADNPEDPPPGRFRPVPRESFLMCKGSDLRFRALSGDIATCHSSVGGEFGERLDPVKVASFARAGAASASRPCREWPPCDEWQNLRLTDGLNPDFYMLCSRRQSHTSGQQFMGNSLWE